MKKGSSSAWPDVVLVLALFAVALTVRVLYQHESVITAPIRADAHRYFSAAYNLADSGEYSIASPFGTPVEDSPYLLPPGYPLFLSPFILATRSVPEFLDLVGIAQALLGSLTAVLAFALARVWCPAAWAFLAGLLTALSPHLTALDHYLLSESLFTFVVTLGALALLLSWQERGMFLSLGAGLVFGFALLIRPVALLLGPFAAIVYMFRPRDGAFASWKTTGAQLCLFLAGYALIYAPYTVFQGRMTAGRPPSKVMLHLYYGADVGLKNFVEVKRRLAATEAKRELLSDRGAFTARLKERLTRSPWSFLKWYGGGKILFMWRWDSFYIGDVYQYPMTAGGFERHPLLRGVHRLMKAAHWPLYGLALIAPFLFLYSRAFGERRAEDAVAVPLLVFIYFAALLTVLVPLPRYALPLRPVSYVLSLYSLKEIAEFGRRRIFAG